MLNRKRLPLILFFIGLLASAFLIPRAERPAMPDLAIAPEPEAAIIVEENLARITHPAFETRVENNAVEYRRAGHHVRFTRGPQSSVRKKDGGLVIHHADGVVEHIDVRRTNIEQSFHYETKRPGPIVVEGTLESDLTARPDPEPGAGVYFWNETRPVLAYRKAVAIDAAGRSLPLSIQYKNGRVRMEIPESWLEEATWPVVLDPLLGPANELDVAFPDGPAFPRWKPDVAYNPSSDTSLVAWQSGNVVRHQIVTPLAVPQGTAVFSTFDRFHPQVAYLEATDEFLVVYDDMDVVYGLRVDANGVNVGAEFVIGDEGSTWDQSPAIAAAPDGWFVVWHSNSLGTATLFGQKLDDTGAPVGNPINVSGTGNIVGTAAGGALSIPQIAYLDDIYLVTFRDSSNNIVAQRIEDSNLQTIGGTIQVAPNGIFRDADVAADDTRFLVTWIEYLLNGTTIDSYVHGFFIETNGTTGVGTLNLATLISNPNTVIHGEHGIAWSEGAGEFLVTYTYDPNTGVAPDCETTVLRVNPNGTVNAAPEAVATDGWGKTDPNVAAGANDEAIVLGRGPSSTSLMAYPYATSGAAPVPVLTVSPTTLTFDTAPGLNPPTQPITVTNSGGAPLSWTAAFLGGATPWFSVTPTSGTLAPGASATLTAQVDVTNLATGTYNTSILIAAPGATGSPISVAVTLNISAGAVLSVTPGTLSFTAAAGGANPPLQSVTVENTGGASLTFSAIATSLGAASNWLSVTPTSGTLAPGASQDLDVTVDIANLTPSSYNGTVLITAAGVTGSPATVNVTLDVTGAPVLTVAPNGLTFATGIGANPASQTFSVENTGAGTLGWTATDNQAWLTLTPTSGSLTAGQSVNVTANVDVTGLAAGTYTATITVTGAGQSATVSVTLTVSSGPVLAVSPTAVTLDAIFGGAGSVQSNVTVSNNGSGTLTWSATDNVAWLTLSPTSGALAGGTSESMTLNASATGLAPGTYNGVVTVTNALGGSETVNVTLNVNQLPTLDLSATDFTFTSEEGVPVASQAVVISNVGGGSFNWTATSSDPLLALVPSAGTLASGQSTSADIQVDTTGIPAGTYTGTITIDAPGASGAPDTIMVTLTVTPRGVGGGGGGGGGGGSGGGCSSLGGRAPKFIFLLPVLILWVLLRRRTVR